MDKKKGSFTLPGESGYERLTLELAEKWGADMIRDSDGTDLSPELVNAGLGIYSTVCIIRDHNEWASKNPDKLQQTFLMTSPVVAIDKSFKIDLMEGFFAEQFQINETQDSLRYWQIYDRTSGVEIPRDAWSYACGKVTIANAVPWHRYTVSFMAYRIWEEISMYNHTTNNWDKEHLVQIDPIYPETQAYMLKWLDDWCRAHPNTSVVRFTSLFYNFVWIWGSSARNRNLFTDWASYDFTVSLLALDLFAEKYGYPLTAEDFVNGGKMQVTHMPPTRAKIDWMDFINEFVTGFGKQLVDVVKRHGKKAYVFYDDSWVGIEPYSERFPEFGFDGLIKCVFSGFEARLCASVSGVKVKELRLHPYLFPVGLGGAPTFMEGGSPSEDALRYWVNVRRALLRSPVDRIGLGGYLSLTLPFPDFHDCVEKIADEFRQIKELHKSGAPAILAPRIGVLTAWGKLRSWTCSGHYHENLENDLINVIESLSGLPFDVEFLSFDEINTEALKRVNVIINAGFAGNAWSGGELWKDDDIITALTEWVHGGGIFLGVNAPSAVEGYDTYLRMAHVLGVDIDTGARVNHGRWLYKATETTLIPEAAVITPKENVYLTDGKAVVLKDCGNLPCVTQYKFGNGAGIYLSSYRHSMANARMLLNLICPDAISNNNWVSPHEDVDCAYYPSCHTVVYSNSSNQNICINVEDRQISIEPYGLAICRKKEEDEHDRNQPLPIP